MTEPLAADSKERAYTLEEALRASEARSRSAENIDRIGTYEHDVATGLSVWSQGLKEIVGTRAENPVDPAKELLPRLHPEDRAAFRAAAEQALSDPNGGEHDIEYRILRDDGDVRWLRDAGCIIYDESDGELRPLRVVGSVIDLTQQRTCEANAQSREQQVQQAFARSQAIFRQMTEGLVIFDASGNLVDMNPAALRIHGFESVDALRRHLHELGDIFDLSTLDGRPLDTDGWPIARALRGESFIGLEVRVQRRDTGRTWIGSYGGTPVYGPDGELDVAIVTLREVTAQKEAEAALAQAKARIDVALKATEVGLWHWDLRQDRVHADANLLRLFGLGGEERDLPLAPFLACIHPDDRERVVQRIEAAASRAQEFQEEYRVVHPDGQIRWLHVRGRTEPDERGVTATFPGVAVDVTERKLAEERLHSLVQVSPFPAIIHAEDGEIILHNAAWLRLSGYDPQDIATIDAWAERAYGERRRQVTEHISSTYALDSMLEEGEFTITTADGGKRVWMFYSAPIGRDDQGRRRIVSTAADVTERRAAEKALQESRELLRTVTQTIPDPLFAKDRQGRMLVANPATLAAVGKTADEVLGRTDAEWLNGDPRQAEAMMANDRRVIEGGRTETLEEWVTRKDDRRLYLGKKAPIRNAAGDVIGLVGVFRDVTDERRAQDALREREARLSFHFENTPLGVVEWDADFRISRWSGDAERIFGWSAGEVLGKHPTEWPFVHEDDAATVRRFLDDLLSGAQTRNVNFNRNYHKDGSVVHCEWYNSALWDGGALRSVLSLVLDVTERTLAQERLQEADRRKDEFLATLAHELRNPLAPIRTGVDLLLQRRDDPAATERTLAMMNRQLTHLVRLVDDLLDVSRVSRGKIVLHKEHLDLGQIIDSALEMSEVGITRHARRLSVHLPAEPLPVEGDRVRLVQVLANLLNNAANFSEDDGRIWVLAERRGEQVQVSVRDEGVGIPSEQLPKVFEMFSQAQAQTGRAGGLGIGLNLARRLVEMHGGSISAHSDGPGRGATFTLILPLSRQTPGAAAAPVGSRSGSVADRRILIVDDNKDIADALSMLLQTLGAQTEVVYGGADALDALPRFCPDVMLADIGMPEMDGYELARQVRQRYSAEQLMLVAVTGWGADEDRRRVREAGFDHHLVKPVGVAKLKAVLTNEDGAAARSD